MAVPHLLVSVRSPEEARAALAGGADLIDVKEPTRGPLGGSDPETIGRILRLVREEAPDVPVSAALGELTDLEQEARFPGFVDYVKVGLAGCGARSGWQDAFFRLQDRFDAEACGTQGFGPRWIAVAYVDHAAAGAPPLAEVFDHALEADCYGLLFDTYSKSAGRLTDALGGGELAEWIERAHDCDLFVAGAGRVDLETLGTIVPTGLDIVAIRSAACRAGERLGEVDPEAVRRFRERMSQLAASAGP